MEQANEIKRPSLIKEYVEVLSGIIKTPKVFYSEAAQETDWRRPTRVMTISAAFFAIASGILGMPGNPAMTMAIGFANALGMVLVNACMGYLVMGFTQAKPVAFKRYYAVYAYAAAVVLTFSWMPYMVWITECWRWWLIGCGLNRACGFSVKSAVMIIFLSWLIVLLLFWSLLPLSMNG